MCGSAIFPSECRAELVDTTSESLGAGVGWLCAIAAACPVVPAAGILPSFHPHTANVLNKQITSRIWNSVSSNSARPSLTRSMKECGWSSLGIWLSVAAVSVRSRSRNKRSVGISWSFIMEKASDVFCSGRKHHCAFSYLQV